MFHRLKSFGRMLAESVMPAQCEVCGRPLVDGEQMLCLSCLYAMPRTNAHREQNSMIHQRLAEPGLPIDRTAAMFSYVRDNEYALMLQRAKYNDRSDIVRRLGEMFARELLAEGFFDGIDMLMPVPLHRLKQWRRGYNQSEQICLGINEVTSLPIGDNLTMRRHSTQTRKSSAERQLNMADVAGVRNPDELAGLHVLLVDDIITTGATLRSVARAIHLAQPSARISVLTLGATLHS